jgi:class 3 adenylate cyclase
MRDVEVRFAEHAGDVLAFTVFGDGPRDLLIDQAVFPIDLMWELPQLATFMEALGSIARVIVFDGASCGASDPSRAHGAAVNEALADEYMSVLNAADSDRATVFSLGGNGSALIAAATYPEGIRSVILVNFRSAFPEFRDLSAAQLRRIAMRLRSPEWLRVRDPRIAHDPALQRWWTRSSRLLTSPDGTVQKMQDAALVDIESHLGEVRVPTLVLHRRDNRVWDITASRAAAQRIPGSRFVELPGAETDIFLGDTAPVLAEIARFLTERQPEAALDRPLATVLFTDIVSSTEHLVAAGDDAWRHLLDDHDKLTDRLVAEHRGRVVKPTGDGILATFDGPARAVRCAAALLQAAKAQGISLRAGLHTGEIELRRDDVAGIAVHIASRISALAGPNEILVSRTVVDLTAGSGLQFEPHGDHELKGVPGTWPVFSTDPAIHPAP